MGRQNRLGPRDLLAGNGTLGRVADGIAAVAGGGVASGEGNAHYDLGAFCDLATCAAAFGRSMFALSRGKAERKNHAGGSPTGEWTRQAQLRAVASDPSLGLTAAATGQLCELRESGHLPARAAFGIDKTLIKRWDGRPGDALIRGRTEKGRQCFEAYMTAQCTERGAGITVAVARYLPHHTVGGQLFLIGSRVLEACAAAGISPVLLMDREFFTAEAVEGLNALGAEWLMPCPNTLRVVDALREHAEGRRPRVSTMRVADGHGRDEPYTMIIEKRKRRAGAEPEEIYIAFAASGPDVDVREYWKRWGVETGYRMVGSARIRSSSRSEEVRTLCFVMSLAVHNAWVMACAAAVLASRGGWVTQAEFCLGLVMEMAASVLGSRPEPEPPPPVAP